MVFHLNNGVYESNNQQIVAVGLNHETGEAIKSLEPMFTIYGKGKGYQLKRTLFGGHKQHIKTFKTVKSAIEFAESLENNTVEDTKEEKKMTVKELRAKAKEMGIKGYSRMSKEQLKAEIEGIDSFLSAKGKTILMKAFTGMVIGKFEVVDEEGINISVKTKKGLLTFNKETGIQVDANNPRFANKFEWA